MSRDSSVLLRSNGPYHLLADILLELAGRNWLSWASGLTTPVWDGVQPQYGLIPSVRRPSSPFLRTGFCQRPAFCPRPTHDAASGFSAPFWGRNKTLSPVYDHIIQYEEERVDHITGLQLETNRRKRLIGQTQRVVSAGRAVGWGQGKSRPRLGRRPGFPPVVEEPAVVTRVSHTSGYLNNKKYNK